jgi:hypothetical protein
MKTFKSALFIGAALAAGQGLIFGQTITYNGTVPTTFSILNTSDATLTASDSAVFASAIGAGTAQESTQQIHLRSNAPYALSAQVTGNTGIPDAATPAAAGHTGQAITLADIGFGVSAINVAGASVVNGGGSPTRSDTTATGFIYVTPTVADGRITTFGTGSSLHAILAAAVQIQSGDRISASGDNGSNDNYILLSLKAGYLPEYFSPTDGSGGFTVVITLTVAASGA